MKKRFGIFILILLLAVTVGACNRTSNGLVGTWEHYATVWDDVPHETLGTFHTFYADGAGRIWHPEVEGDTTFEWETANGKLFFTQDIPAWIHDVQAGENPMPDETLQLILEGLSGSFLYEIDGDELILIRENMIQSVHEVFIRIN
jgi:hypothetical protein